MPEMYVQKADFLNKVFVDQNIRKLVEEDVLWERLLTKQSVDALNVRYYKEQYQDIETPNDTARGASIDTILRNPGYRAPGGLFPHTQFGEPIEMNLGLYQLALEADIPDEAVKYQEMESVQLRAQRKLANSFVSRVNSILGGVLSENWTASPSNIGVITASEGWDSTASTNKPVLDVLRAVEKIEDVAGYNYKPEGIYMSKQSYFDLRAWLADHNYQYGLVKPGPGTEVPMVEGLAVYSTNMVKRDFAIVGDFKASGVLYEAEPMTTHQYYTDADHVTHVQLSRTFNFGLSDPKAVCTIVDTTE